MNLIGAGHARRNGNPGILVPHINGIRRVSKGQQSNISRRTCSTHERMAVSSLVLGTEVLPICWILSNGIYKGIKI